MSTHRDPATDQPEPIQTSEPSVHDLVIDVIRERKNLGMRKYGTVLQASNGRDHLTDAIEEAADLLAYLAAERETRRIRTERTPTLREAVARAIYEAACPPAEDAPTGTRWEEWHETDEPNREEWREIADAVLAVLPRTEASLPVPAPMPTAQGSVIRDCDGDLWVLFNNNVKAKWAHLDGDLILMRKDEPTLIECFGPLEVLFDAGKIEGDA